MRAADEHLHQIVRVLCAYPSHLLTFGFMASLNLLNTRLGAIDNGHGSVTETESAICGNTAEVAFEIVCGILMVERDWVTKLSCQGFVAWKKTAV